VDATTDDDTAAVALKHGAKVVTGHQVSEWHECPAHGRVLAQDFARARQESFKHLRQDVDWWGWVDADDVVEGGGHLAEYLATIPPESVGAWLPYVYSRTPNGLPGTLFHRERLLRRAVGWEWRRRVHETAHPIGKSDEEAGWVETDRIRVVHQDAGHNTAGSARRNILLLEIELEEHSDDPWALYYLGNQHFALNDWRQAIRYYEASLNTPNVYQKWQTYIYLSMAYERLGDLGASLNAAFHALDVRPEHPEPYYRLAALYMLQGDAGRCQFWTRLGDGMKEAPFFAFKNPMDRPYNARVTLGQAYRNAGRIGEARRELERAAAVIPTAPVLAGLAECQKLETDAAQAEALVRVLAGHDDGFIRQLWGILNPPADVRRFGRVRDVVMPALLRQRPSTQPRIIFWCGNPVEPWAPPSLNTTGIGGSETAVVHVARRFADDGWRVDVFNGADRYEGEYDGVGYWDLGRLGADERTDVLVSWRNPGAHGLPVAARARLLWCHDLNRGPDLNADLPRWDRVLGVSRWHATYLAQVYGLTNAEYVPNGIDLSRFDAVDRSHPQKAPFRCVYASSPDRGLLTLLQFWPQIVAQEPTAELHVGYGWETFDKAIAAGARDLAVLKARVEELLKTTPRVVWRGRLPQDDLAKLYSESYCWLYPTTFTEVSCISAMEAMAGGCVPVTSAVGALPEAIGDGGIVVAGNAYTAAWAEFWLSCAKATLLSPDVRLPAMRRGLERARQFTWEASYERWKGLVAGLLEGPVRQDREAVLA